MQHMDPDAFAEDPLRVFRVARFAAQFDFKVTSVLWHVMRRMRDELRHLSGERVFAEMMKALQSDHPRRFFDVLNDTKCLEQWFPELHEMAKRPAGPVDHHPEGTAYEHTMLVVQRARELGASDNAMFGALVHDYGKSVTPMDNMPRHHNHEELGVDLVEDFGERMRAPASMVECGRLSSAEHLKVHRWDEVSARKRVGVVMRLGRHAEDVTLVSQADAQGRGPASSDDYPQRQAVLDTQAVVRSVKGHTVLSQAELSGEGDGEVIANKIHGARVSAVKRMKHVQGG